MQKPSWFVLIEQWKIRGMGQYGVTLPFLIGALGKSASEVVGLLHQIANSPVPGYVTEVRWCQELAAPTFAVFPIGKTKMYFESFISGPSGEKSLGFSKDLQSMFGLNCKGSDQCLEKLAEHAIPTIGKGCFSRILNPNTNELEWGGFTQSENQFIKDVIGRDSREP